MNIEVMNIDCLKGLKTLCNDSVDVVVTSPPYNLKIKYGTYKDNLKRDEYLAWLHLIFEELKRIMKEDASFFLNMGSSNVDPWVSYDVANQARNLFLLQNNIAWVKSVSVGDSSHGHFKPINSKRFINHNFEHIFHFTKTGNVSVDRLAIGVPYADKSNIKRWKGAKADKRCKGNTWFIPYKTIRLKSQKGTHPAIFPEELVENCLRLHGFNSETVVLDPFLGTGTTLVVAKKLGISGIGMDIDKDYIKFTQSRLAELDSGIFT